MWRNGRGVIENDERKGLYVSAELHISTVFFNRFKWRCEESLEFILARQGRKV